jgi:hypothetical protein
VGDWRIIYEVSRENKVIVVIAIKRRGSNTFDRFSSATRRYDERLRAFELHHIYQLGISCRKNSPTQFAHGRSVRLRRKPLVNQGISLSGFATVAKEKIRRGVVVAAAASCREVPPAAAPIIRSRKEWDDEIEKLKAVPPKPKGGR